MQTQRHAPRRSSRAASRAPGSTPKPANMRRALAYAMLLVLVLSFLAYAIKYVDAPSGYDDDNAYIDNGFAFATGAYVENLNPISARVLMTVPIGLSYILFGTSPLSSAAWCIISYIGTIIAVFLIARELSGETAGILAAMFAGFFPELALLAPTVDDMVPFAFLTSLAMYCILVGRRRNKPLGHAAGGVLLVGSILVTPLGFITLVFALVYYVACLARSGARIAGRGFVALLVGIVIGSAAAGAFSYVNSGNPLMTLLAYGGFYSSENIGQTIVLNPSFYFGLMFPPLGSALYSEFSVYFYMALAASAYVVLRRKRGAYFPLAWLWFTMLYLIAGPMSVSVRPLAYYVIPEVNRYLVALAPPIAVLLGISCATAFGWLLGPRPQHKHVHLAAAALLAAFVALVFYSSGSWSITRSVNSIGYGAGMRGVASYLSTAPYNGTGRVYLPPALPAMQTYLMFSGHNLFHRLEIIQPGWNCSTFAPGSYVVLQMGTAIASPTNSSNPANLCGWHAIMNGSAGMLLYHVGPGG